MQRASLSTPTPPSTQVSTVSYRQNFTNKVDVLFMLDNSNGALMLQVNLKNGIESFLKPLEDLSGKGIYVDLHIGVVSSDFGAGATGAPGCTPSGPKGGGDQGKLIAIGRKASANCQKPRGVNFLS